jgi:hypothetical protein
MHCTSEMSVYFDETSWSCTLEGCHLHPRCSENLESHILDTFLITVIFFRYFNRLIESKTGLLPSPCKIHGEKLIRTLAQCLEKVCYNKD